MGCGTFTARSFTDYTVSKGMSVDTSGRIAGDYTPQQMFRSHRLDEALNPKNVIRECCDNEEHPNTIPVILALDVTGSMGHTAVEIAKQLNVIMTKLYEKITDVEFMVMGIGDLAYDNVPIQASQFESDIRIAEQLDKIYFEFGGGGNSFESYTAAWYFGARHTKLDCWKRGKKGIIITMGDECLNPYLPRFQLEGATGDDIQGDISTDELYDEVSEKYEVYHLDVEHGRRYLTEEEIAKSYLDIIPADHFRRVNINSITDEIVDIIIGAVENANSVSVSDVGNSEISW